MLNFRSIFYAEKNNKLFSLHKLNVNSKGQILLIVVLVMVVSLTVGLSLVSRSIVNLRISTEEKNSQAAFSAAEAGIERVLKSGVPLANESLSNNSTIKQTNISEIRDSEGFLLNGGNSVDKDDGADIWLSDYSTNPTLRYQNPFTGGFVTLYWGDTATDCNNAAIEVILISSESAYPKSNRYAYDKCAARRNVNHFNDSSFVSANYLFKGKTFRHKVTINLNPPNSPLLARVIPLYLNSLIGVSGCDGNGANCVTLPSQGKKIESIGTSGMTTRKVVYYQSYSKIPAEFFQYNLFSP